MKVVFRADSSTVIGTGHLMRCLTLADELSRHDVEITFVTRLHNGNMSDLIQKKGYQNVLLDEPVDGCVCTKEDGGYAHWLGVPWKQDAEETILAIREMRPDWLIVDHYAIDSGWEKLLRQHVSRIMVIDDLANRKHDCDILLDQNYYQNLDARYAGLVPEGCDLYCGPRYALLRKEFLEQKVINDARDKDGKNIFLFFGGADPENVSGRVLEMLADLDRDDLSVSVVMGASNPNQEEISKLCGRNSNIVYFTQVDTMAELMAGADIAVGAGGSNTWERCCLGLPSIVITYARNQVETTRDLAEDGYIIYVGDAEKELNKPLGHAINLLLDNSILRNALSKKSHELVDGMGAARIIKNLMTKKVHMRPAADEDSDDIIAWRNAEETRRFFLNSSPITKDDHAQWYKNKLSDPSCIFLIGETSDGPVGVIRYDVKEGVALVSVYLVPGKYGQGYGVSLIKEGNKWLFEKNLNVKKIQADILPDNGASIGAFQKAGFTHSLSTYSYCLTKEK